MKTSKIIFISFFSIVGLFLLSLMIQTKPENRGNKELRNMKHEKIALPIISHLVVQGKFHLTLTKGVSDSIKFGYAEDAQLVQPIHQVKGDTLIVNPFPNNKGFYTEVYCNQLKTITIDSTTVEIKMIKFPELSIVGKHCEINCWDGVSIDSAIIDLKANSELRYHNSEIIKAQIVLDKSKAELYTNKIDEVKADLFNNSELSVEKVLRSEVKTDESSRFYSR